MTTTATKRRCAGKTCITILSSYNDDPDGLCGPCRKTQTDEWVARLREQMEERERRAAEAVVIPEAIPAASPPKRKAKWTQDELLEELDRWKRTGREYAPSITQADALGMPKRSTFIKHFGSWRRAIDRAGLLPNQPLGEITPARLRLLAVVERADRALTTSEITVRLRQSGDDEVTNKSVRDMAGRMAGDGLITRTRIDGKGFFTWLYSAKDSA